MPQVRFEPTIPVFERAKTVHALDRAATVIGFCTFVAPNFPLSYAVRVLLVFPRTSCLMCILGCKPTHFINILSLLCEPVLSKTRGASWLGCQSHWNLSLNFDCSDWWVYLVFLFPAVRCWHINLK
jgi:hypothetical protein